MTRTKKQFEQVIVALGQLMLSPHISETDRESLAIVVQLLSQMKETYP